MNAELISFITGASFGVFLTIQYSIFFFFTYKKKDLKKSALDLLFIVLMGVSVMLSCGFGTLSMLIPGRFFMVLFNQLKIVSGVLCMVFFVLLLRHILLTIKDTRFVETDEYKTKSLVRVWITIIISLIMIIGVALSDISYNDRSVKHSLVLLVFLVYMFFVGFFEAFEFRKVLSREIGKITPMNIFRYNTILYSGISAIIFVMIEIVLILMNRMDIIQSVGSFYVYGLDIVVVSLSLNLIIEYMEVLTRANEANKKLSDLNRQMMDDVRTAQSLQISLLPLDKQKIIQNYVDMEISYMPMQSVGGDYYDFYKLSETQLLLFLGDASGHGVYAAMIWAMLKVEVEELIEDKQFNNLSQAFTLLNKRITRILENTYSYATLFACLIDLEKKQVSYISAGHTDQLYYLVGKNAVNRIRNKNPIIGTFKNVKFTDDSISYHAGDAILMFSDGIVEGTNPEGEALGKERLEDTFLEACLKGGSAQAIIGDLLLSLEDFFEGTLQKDDRTIMVIKL